MVLRDRNYLNRPKALHEGLSGCDFGSLGHVVMKDFCFRGLKICRTYDSYEDEAPVVTQGIGLVVA